MSELPPGEFPRNANERIFDRNVRHGHDVQRWREGLCKRMKKSIGSAANDIILSRADTQIKRISKAKKLRTRLDRTAAAERAIRKETRKQLTKIRNKLKAELAEAAKMEVDFQMRTLNWELRGTGLVAKRPPIKQVKRFASGDPFRGQNMNAWMRKLEDDIVSQSMRDIREGIRAGETESQLKRRLRGRKGMASKAKRDLCAIAKTGANSAVDIARELTYVENRRFIKGVQYIAILDNRTSIICASLDGKIFPFNKGPRPPQHFNCRSTTSPVLKTWKGMGAKADRTTDFRKEWLDGKAPRRITYPEWLAKQNVDVQNDVLGKTKGQAFRDGKLKVDGMVDQSNRPLTLQEIRNKENI